MPGPFGRLVLAAAIYGSSAIAEIVSFEDVEYYDKRIEDGQVNKRDGMFHLDRDTGVIAFTSENRVWLTIASQRITSVTYDDKHDRRLVILYNDARDRTREAAFKLKGGNRENILNLINSETENKLVRVTKK
jgi:hypothetical protein